MNHSTLSRARAQRKKAATTPNKSILSRTKSKENLSEEKIEISGEIGILNLFNKTKKRYFELIEDKLCSYKSKGKKKRRVFNLSNLEKIETLSKRPNGIHLISKQNELFLIFNEYNEKARWLKLLRKFSNSIKFFLREVIMVGEITHIEKNVKFKRSFILTKNNLYIIKKKSAIELILILSTSDISAFLSIFSKFINAIITVKDIEIFEIEKGIEIITTTGQSIELSGNDEIVNLLKEKLKNNVEKNEEKNLLNKIKNIKRTQPKIDEKLEPIFLDCIKNSDDIIETEPTVTTNRINSLLTKPQDINLPPLNLESNRNSFTRSNTSQLKPTSPALKMSIVTSSLSQRDSFSRRKSSKYSFNSKEGVKPMPPPIPKTSFAENENNSEEKKPPSFSKNNAPPTFEKKTQFKLPNKPLLTPTQSTPLIDKKPKNSVDRKSLNNVSIIKPPSNKPPLNKPPSNKPPLNKPPLNKPPLNKPPLNKPPSNKPPLNKPPLNKPPPKPLNEIKTNTLNKSPNKQDWTCEEVADWMCGISKKFEIYRSKIIENDVDGEMIISLITEKTVLKMLESNEILANILWEKILELRESK